MRETAVAVLTAMDGTDVICATAAKIEGAIFRDEEVDTRVLRTIRRSMPRRI